MLGSVDRSHAAALVRALAAARRPRPCWPRVEQLRDLGLSAAGTLEEMAVLLQQMAVRAGGAWRAAMPATPNRPMPARWPALLAADETQLLYSMVLHGRGELQLMADEYAALTMVLLRLLAFAPDVPQPAARGAVAARPPAARGPLPPATTAARCRAAVAAGA